MWEQVADLVDISGSELRGLTDTESRGGNYDEFQSAHKVSLLLPGCSDPELLLQAHYSVLDLSLVFVNFE